MNLYGITVSLSETTDKSSTFSQYSKVVFFRCNSAFTIQQLPNLIFFSSPPPSLSPPPGVELLQLLLAVPSAVYSEVGEGLCVPGVLCH